MMVRFGGIPVGICVVAVIGVRDRWVGVAWRHTPVTHDDPDRRPNRGARTLTGPSQMLRWCVAREHPDIGGTSIMGTPHITSCCQCRGA